MNFKELVDRVSENKEIQTMDHSSDLTQSVGIDSVRIKKLTSRERDDWEVSQTKLSGIIGKKKISENESFERLYGNLRARFLVRVIVDQNNNRVFDDAYAEKLGEMPSDVIADIYNAASKYNGISKQDTDEMEKMEELEKN